MWINNQLNIKMVQPRGTKLCNTIFIVT